jgi:invasion protein IalB
VVPLETLLTEQLTISVDGAQPKRYPFTWCAPLGCIARVGFTQAEIDGFKKGAKATILIVPAGAPNERVNLDLSLKGFTAGFDAVSKTPAQ